jgi:hypothetical protein
MTAEDQILRQCHRKCSVFWENETSLWIDRVGIQEVLRSTERRRLVSTRSVVRFAARNMQVRHGNGFVVKVSRPLFPLSTSREVFSMKQLLDS